MIRIIIYGWVRKKKKKYIVAMFWDIVDVSLFFKYAKNSKKYRKQKHSQTNFHLPQKKQLTF